MERALAALASLAVALLVALIVYSMPVGQSVDAALLGAAFGLFPIMWIVWNAIWIYNMTQATGHFAVLRRSFGRISDDQRVQAVLIAFCFGALLEALAGFGTPVAITRIAPDHAARWSRRRTSRSGPRRSGSLGAKGELFRRVIGWSLVLLLIMCVLVYLQTTAVLSWMVV